MKFDNKGFLIESEVPFKLDLIPKETLEGRKRFKLNAMSITVHNPGNKGSAEAQTEYVDYSTRYADWHFTVGKNIVYQEMSILDNTWHAGDGEGGTGNRTSISMEIEESPEAEETAIKFIRELKKCFEEIQRHIIPVYPHKHWSGKECPRTILPHWEEFAKGVNGEMTKRQIQESLNKLGYGPLSVDGNIGPSSKAAIKRFQHDHGLVEDGSPGPATQAELKKQLDLITIDELSIEEQVKINTQKIAQLEKKL